jgi:hypothetical protein
MSEQKQRIIKFAPLITAPDPVDPTTIACTIDDYNALVKLGFYVLHKSQSLVTFTKNFTLENGQVCNTNLRFEKDSWQCTVMLQFDRKEQIYETFYSAKYKNLKDLMCRLKLTFNTIKEFFDCLSDNCQPFLR